MSAVKRAVAYTTTGILAVIAGLLFTTLVLAQSPPSPESKPAGEGGITTVDGARAACRDDARKFCAGILPGRGRILHCLAGHKDAIAPACRGVVVEVETAAGR